MVLHRHVCTQCNVHWVCCKRPVLDWGNALWNLAIHSIGGTRVGKHSATQHRPQCFCIFNYGQALWGKLLQGYTICYIHCQWARPAHVAEFWPLAQLQMLQNSGSLRFLLRVKTLSSWALHCQWRNSRKKLCSRVQQYKRARFITVLIHWLALCQEKW